jgi:hypothetical protein
VDGVDRGDGVRVGLDLGGAVAAGCLHKLPCGPAGLVFDPLAMPISAGSVTMTGPRGHGSRTR